jgi:hypothetical protein
LQGPQVASIAHSWPPWQAPGPMHARVIPCVQNPPCPPLPPVLLLPPQPCAVSTMPLATTQIKAPRLILFSSWLQDTRTQSPKPAHWEA